MNKIKISAVSYTNTKPFIFGLEHSAILDQIELCLDIPTDCAAKLIHNQADIGLIPVAAIPLVPNANIVSDYCIGSFGAVNSVFIFSNVPVSEIRTLKLDPQSRTSNNLARVLLKNYWNRDVQVVSDLTVDADAVVLIGDRTFGKKAAYNYAYDMGEEWMQFTGLPFVYAAWVANKAIPAAFIEEFNEALAFGLDNRRILLKKLPAHPDFDLEDYLFNKLNFELDSPKKQGLDLFLSYVEKL